MQGKMLTHFLDDKISNGWSNNMRSQLDKGIRQSKCVQRATDKRINIHARQNNFEHDKWNWFIMINNISSQGASLILRITLWIIFLKDVIYE